MKETPIIMSGDHPKLIIDGLKTQTRRTYGLETVNRNPNEYKLINFDGLTADFARGNHNIAGVNVAVVYHCKCPYGQVGDRLWVKETFWQDQSGGVWIYKAGGLGFGLKDTLEPEWPPSNCGGKAIPIIKLIGLKWHINLAFYGTPSMPSVVMDGKLIHSYG